jgi:FAD:protein FMN transferase
MGTVYRIVAAEPDTARLHDAMRRALGEVARLEDLLSEWRPDTELSRVNQAAGREAVKVGPEILAVVKEGLRVGAESGGAFDITWAALHGVWDFRARPPHVPDRALLAAKTKLIDWRKVQVDEAASTIRLAEPGMAIGLGGIAKGYAVDRAGAILLAAGFRSFVIYAGGQVGVWGTRGGRPWRVGIQDPRREGFFATFEMTHGSAATSGDYERYFILDGVRYHHIIDTRPDAPDRGMPARGMTSVTVIAEDGLTADAVDTAIFILGPDAGMALARRRHVEAVLVTDRMQVLATDGIRSRLHARPLAPPSGP